MTNLSEISTKIEKLLRLSQSSNQHESELAMQKAKELAMQHDLDLSSLEASANQEVKEEFIKESVDNEGKQSSMAVFINDILVNHFKVYVVTSRVRYQSTTTHCIGRKSDIETAKFVRNFLEVTFVRLWKEFKRKYNLPTTEKKTYFQGLWSGLNQKLREIEESTLKKSDIDIQNRYALIVKNEIELRKDAAKDFFNNLKEASSKRVSTNGSLSTYLAGQQAGKDININHGLTQKDNNLCLA